MATDVPFIPRAVVQGSIPEIFRVLGTALAFILKTVVLNIGGMSEGQGG
jgi:hypothetical protein